VGPTVLQMVIPMFSQKVKCKIGWNTRTFNRKT